jgi:hypothetical protein
VRHRTATVEGLTAVADGDGAALVELAGGLGGAAVVGPLEPPPWQPASASTSKPAANNAKGDLTMTLRPGFMAGE